MKAKQRTQEIIKRLKHEYPNAKCSLNYQNPHELMIATILSAQCTDERINIVTQNLFQKYRSLSDFAEVDLLELQEDIRSTGFFRNKALGIQSSACQILEKHGGQVPQSMAELVKLPGIGRKTANVILGNAFGIAAGVVVDTHVKRLSNRLGLTIQKQPEKIETDLAQLVPKSDWVIFPHLMIAHGRKVCQARKPKCESCILNDICPSGFSPKN